MATSANVIGYYWRMQRDGRTRRPRDCRLRECDDDRGGTRIAHRNVGAHRFQCLSLRLTATKYAAVLYISALRC